MCDEFFVTDVINEQTGYFKKINPIVEEERLCVIVGNPDLFLSFFLGKLAVGVYLISIQAESFCRSMG